MPGVVDVAAFDVVASIHSVLLKLCLAKVNSLTPPSMICSLFYPSSGTEAAQLSRPFQGVIVSPSDCPPPKKPAYTSPDAILLAKLTLTLSTFISQTTDDAVQEEKQTGSLRG